MMAYEQVGLVMQVYGWGVENDGVSSSTYVNKNVIIHCHSHLWKHALHHLLLQRKKQYVPKTWYDFLDFSMIS